MLTPAEYLRRFDAPPRTIWVHGLELLAHILRGDATQTFYRDPDHERRYLLELQEAMEASCAPQNDQLNRVMEGGLRRHRRWRRFDDYTGDLDVGRYISWRPGDDPRLFNNYENCRRLLPSMNILLDMAIPYVERGLGEMAQRHQEVYELALQAANENRPCRVVACWSVKIRELREPLNLFVVVKDFGDPLFGGIWGALRTNATTNSLLNAIMDYFIGTSSGGNGHSTTLTASEHFTDGEVRIVRAKRIVP